MKTKFKSVIIAAIMLATLVISACVQKTEPVAKNETTPKKEGSSEFDQKHDKIVLAAICSLTGEKAIQGEYTKEGGDLFAKNINAAGGILGKQVEIVYEDEAASEQGSINAALKLVTRGDVSGIFGSVVSSSYNIAIMPTILEYEIPLLAGGSSANIKKEQNPYTWQARMSDDLTGISMAKAAVDILGMKKPAIINGSDSFGTGLASETTKALKALYGIDPIVTIVFNPDEVQYTPFLSQIMNSGADGIIAIAHQKDAGVMMKQGKEIGLNMPKLGSTSFCSEIAIAAAKDAADSWYSIGDWTSEVPHQMGKDFVKQYKEAYNRDPDLPAAIAYDSFLIMSEAIQKAGSADPKLVNEQLSKIQALQGVTSTYDALGSSVLGNSKFLVQVEGGKVVLKEVIERNRAEEK